MISSWNFYELPSEPYQFNAEFEMGYYDDDGNECASSPYTQTIELETEIFDPPSGNEEHMRLFGVTSYYTHQAYILPVDNHNHGLSFSIVCRNRHKAVKRQRFWRCYLNSRQVAELFRSSAAEEGGNHKISIPGSFPQLPNSPPAHLIVTLTHIRGKGHVVDGVEMEIPTDYYRRFFERIIN